MEAHASEERGKDRKGEEGERNVDDDGSGGTSSEGDLDLGL